MDARAINADVLIHTTAKNETFYIDLQNKRPFQIQSITIRAKISVEFA